jgi:hypothetical protein
LWVRSWSVVVLICTRTPSLGTPAIGKPPVDGIEVSGEQDRSIWAAPERHI